MWDAPELRDIQKPPNARIATPSKQMAAMPSPRLHLSMADVCLMEEAGIPREERGLASNAVDLLASLADKGQNLAALL